MKCRFFASNTRRSNASKTEIDASHNGGMEKFVVYTLQRRRAKRVKQMRALLHYVRPHGGSVAERVKQGRPNDRSA